MTAPNITPEHLQALLDGATEGPWVDRNVHSVDLPCFYAAELDETTIYAPSAQVAGDAHSTATLIALAPDLARRVIELEAMAAKMADALHHMVNASIHPDQCADGALDAYAKIT